MGNCLDRSRGDRGDAAHCAKKSAVLVEEEGEEELHFKSEKAVAPVKEVKIRITRKQLEELLQRLDEEGGNGGGGAVISELLCMTSSSNFRHMAQAEQWRPALQSIPE